MPHEHRVIAVAADYADALLVARRSQRILILLLVLIVLSQLAIFGTAHFAPDVLRHVTAATQPGDVVHNRADVLHYVTAVSLFAGIILSILLTLVLFLTIHIMLVGRLVGVRDVTRALFLSFVVLFLFVPWQTLLVTQQLGASADYVIPGVLFTWREIAAKVPLAAGADAAHQALYWIRFVAAPLFGLILLLLVQIRSGRGLKYALGEEEIVPAVTDDGGVVITRD